MKGKNAELKKTAIKWWHGPDADAFDTALKENRATAFAFAESRLHRRPDSTSLLKAYLNEAAPQEFPQVKALLKSELPRRPVVVEWHRAYQALSELDPQNDLLTLYDGFLKADPTNGALLYLRGRLEHDWEQQDRLYREAAAKDPGLSWPWMALGKRALAEAKWDEGLKDLLKARELKIDEDEINGEVQTARIAAGQAKALVTEYQTVLKSRPFDLTTVVFLSEAFAAAGEPEKIAPELANWQKLVRNSVPPTLINHFQAIGLYEAGKLEECEKHCRSIPALRSGVYRAQTLLALKRSQEVVSDKSFDGVLADPWTDLAVSLGLSLDNHPQEAAHWREQAIQKLSSSFDQMRRVAKVLGAAQPATDRDLSRIVVDVEMKALVFAVLADRFPASAQITSRRLRGSTSVEKSPINWCGGPSKAPPAPRRDPGNGESRRSFCVLPAHSARSGSIPSGSSLDSRSLRSLLASQIRRASAT